MRKLEKMKIPAELRREIGLYQRKSAIRYAKLLGKEGLFKMRRLKKKKIPAELRRFKICRIAQRN